MPRHRVIAYSAPPNPANDMAWPETSPGISAGADAGILSDVPKLQRLFPMVVARWLKEHFRDKEHIAFFFDTDERTARNWLAGLNCPSGPRAVAMILRFPDLRQRLLEAMAA